MCIVWALYFYYESSDVNRLCFVSGPIVSNLELGSVSKEDDIEACDNIGTPTNPPLVSTPQPLPRIAEQFQEALLAAPSFDCAPLPSVQFPVNQDYSTRLQRILQLEKQQHAEITKGPPLSTPLDSLQVLLLTCFTFCLNLFS